MLNALACFAFVAGYVYNSAIPTYNTPIWEAGVDFRQDMPIPAFAFLIPTVSIGAPPNVFVRSGGRYLPNGTPLEAVVELVNGEEAQYPLGSVHVIDRPSANFLVTAYYANPSTLESTSARTTQLSSLQDMLQFDLEIYCTPSP